MNVMASHAPLATATGPYLYWITSRAAGIAGLILASAAVGAGLLMAGGLARERRAEMRVAHEALALATLAALAIHGLTLLGDGYLHPTLLELAVPFAGSYRTLWTSTGIIAFWSLAALGLGYYQRARIGAQRWRSLHRLTAAAWMLGIVHSLTDGTDSGQAWFLVMIVIVVAPPLALLAARHLLPSALARLTGRLAPAGAAPGLAPPNPEMQRAGSR
jgi:sulfoxide reductase heme-binding subunit YedZ